MKKILVVLFVLAAVCSAHFRAPVSEEQVEEDLRTQQWFTQRTDHFNMQDDTTWSQRYFVNDSFWNPDLGGPIFFLFGGEGPASNADVVRLMMSQYALHYGALQFTLEHRFYGASQPTGDLTTESLSVLSSEQALADAANFLTEMKKQYNAMNSPVITFGGSYSGNLAGWFRLKYPHITLASVASSAPVFATVDFYQYLDVVDESLSDISGLACDQQIQIATNQIQALLATPNGSTQVESLFKTCAPLNGEKDVATLMSTLMGNFMGIVQYDDEGNNPITIKTLCQIMENGGDALTNYVAISNLFLNAQHQTCNDVSYQDSLTLLLNTSVNVGGNVGARQWTYQTCVEFGYFQSTDSPSQPFGNLVPVSYYTQMCNDIFGFDFLPFVNDTNTHYGGKHPQGTNIMWVNGSLDPWHSLSITKTLSDGMPAVVIEGTAHCADFFPARPQDPPGLGMTQQLIDQQIGKWLAGY